SLDPRKAARHTALVKRGVRRILPLTFGWEHLPRRTSMPLVPEAEGRVFLREPVPGLLLEVEDGYVLLDTGFNGALVRDRAFHHRFWGGRSTTLALSGAGDPLEDASAHVAVDPPDVAPVAVR